MSVAIDRPTDAFLPSHGKRQRLPGPPCPTPRGPLSGAVFSALRQDPGSLGPTPTVMGDALSDADLQLALYCCYELHYRGLAGVNPDWKWDRALLSFRGEIEHAFLDRLRDETGPFACHSLGDIGSALGELIASASGPSLSNFLLESGSLSQIQEFCVHRSAYQRKVADRHTIAVPSLSGDAKVAMAEIQFDDYGRSSAVGRRSTLFADTMTALGLDSAYGAYLDELPGPTLATVNLVSMFGLHRRWRAALVGHLATFEMSSIAPVERYSRALAHLGTGRGGNRFDDVQVAGNPGDGAIARDRLVAAAVETEPHLRDDLLFGAAAVLLVEERFARHLLDAWSVGRSSLVPPGLDLCAALGRHNLDGLDPSPSGFGRGASGPENRS